MQLVSFQIKECFGFRDSGQVNLQDPANLIYILGRNSSGKTSFLTALAHFAPGLVPEAHPKFANFDQSSDTPYLLCQYRLEKGDLYVERFIREYHTVLTGLNQGYPQTTSSIEYKKLIEELTKKLRIFYSELIEIAENREILWVRRAAGGQYSFSFEPDMKSVERRKKQIVDLLANGYTQLGITVQRQAQNNVYQLVTGGVWQPFRLLLPDEIEGLLAQQLPMITWFNKAYSLLDELPDTLKLEHLIASPNPLTSALVWYLDKTQVERILKVQNPRDRRELLAKLQNKINTLVDEVNRDSTEDTELLKIDLDTEAGLQITPIISGKSSFYRHLSDNTKLLFAYHLYTMAYNLTSRIFLFDEPNNGFHATAQERLLGFLRDLGLAGNLVIVSTHSEHLIDPDSLTGIRLMAVDKQGYLSIRNTWYKSTTGSGDFQALRPILDAIGLKYGANHLTIRDKVIVTEGVTELLYLRAFRQLLSYKNALHIAPATGDDTIPHVVALLISQGLHFKVVVDTTVGRKGMKDRLQEKYGIPNTSIYEITVPTEFPQAKGSGIEDIFSKADFAKLLMLTEHKPEADFKTLPNSTYMKKLNIVPKRVVAHEFNKHITNFTTDDFDQDTITNIRRLLDFCTNGDWFLL